MITPIGCCCFFANFDLILRLGGSFRPWVFVVETLVAVFTFDVPFIIR